MSLLEWIAGKREKEKSMTAIEAQRHYTNQRSREASIICGPKRLISVSELPPQYDNCEFEGWRVVGGKFCKTVGEYKDACANFYE